MRANANRLASALVREDGVGAAVKVIERYLFHRSYHHPWPDDRPRGGG
jgi:hypothetical protein